MDENIEQSTPVLFSRGDVVSVYSGRAGKCCCGCSGKHTFSSAFRDADTTVNDRTVSRVVRIIRENTSRVELCDDHAAVEVGNRLYVAYLDQRS